MVFQDEDEEEKEEEVVVVVVVVEEGAPGARTPTLPPAAVCAEEEGEEEAEGEQPPLPMGALQAAEDLRRLPHPRHCRRRIAAAGRSGAGGGA